MRMWLSNRKSEISKSIIKKVVDFFPEGVDFFPEGVDFCSNSLENLSKSQDPSGD
jgi:hypothetical protein